MSGQLDTGQRSRPLDASMDLLNQIIRQPVDPDYAVVAARGEPAPRGHWTLALTAVLVGAMFAVAAVQTTRAAPALLTERTELIARIQTAETGQDQQRTQIDALSAEIGKLQSAALSGDEGARTLQAQIAGLSSVAGAAAVSGPGVLIVVDDAPADQPDARDRVLDLDLQVLANGLWQSGAEAIAINGHRLSPLTAIRSAGDAITVDYRSLSRPYRVEAIGDPRTLHASFAGSGAGAWWNELAQNRKMRYEISDIPRVDLDADPGLRLRYAEGVR